MKLYILYCVVSLGRISGILIIIHIKGCYLHSLTAVRYRFCRKLEENSFAGKTADFLVMLIFGATVTLVSESYHTLLWDLVMGLTHATCNSPNIIFLPGYIWYIRLVRAIYMYMHTVF